MPNKYCPICEKEFTDVLKHFSMSHDISSMSELNQRVETIQREKAKQIEYNAFISDLNNKLKGKEISMDEWKRLRDNWERV